MCVCVCVIGSVQGLHAQNDVNIYRDFTGDTIWNFTSAGCKAANQGEYQWYWDERSEYIPYWLSDTLPWSSFYKSWKIGPVSFAFSPDIPRTMASDSITRLLVALASPWVQQGSFHGQQLGPDPSKAFSYNAPSVLLTKSFTSEPFSERLSLPHTVLRHTLYIHETYKSSSRKIDSVSFIVDHTRGAMRRYPFKSSNFLGSHPSEHDIAVRMEIILPDSVSANANSLLSINYFPQDVEYIRLVDSLNEVFCNIPSPNCPYDSVKSVYYARPAPFTFLKARLQMQEGCWYPAGYMTDPENDSLMVPTGGITHHYFINSNVDISKINSIERIVYNPSEVQIEADSLVFPEGYTFQTIRGKYPTQAEVDSSDLCAIPNVPAQYVIVPTDLEVSKYRLRAGSRLFIEPCVYLYDMTLHVDSGAYLSFYPDGTYGNYTITVDEHGVVDSLEYSGLCNNCRCIQEHTLSSNFNVSSNITVSSDAIINALVTVKSGATLNIRNCVVQFTDSKRVGKRSGIVVEAGGKLVLDNATLTVLECDQLWDGVVVHGNPAIEDPFVSTSNQGGVRMINGSTISFARIGLNAGRFCDGLVSCRKLERFNVGGILEVDSANFINNRISIRFAPYTKRNLSYIRRAHFQTNQYLDFLVLDDHRIEHVLLDGKNGLPISLSTFSNTAFEHYPDYKRGTGVINLNSFASVDSNVFYGLTRAVDGYTFGSLSRRLNFRNNAVSETYFPVTLRGGRLDRILQNTFQVPSLLSFGDPPFGGVIVDTSYAVYLLGTQFFTVAANKFLSDSLSSADYPYALAVRNSGLGGGSSFRNRMQGYAIGIQTEADNRNLLLRCDTLVQQRNTDYRLNPPHGDALLLDSLADFGTACEQGQTANNIFLGSSYNVNAGLVVPKYYASERPTETLPNLTNIDTQLVNCGFEQQDSLSCPLFDFCWLIDCPISIAPDSVAILIGEDTTSIPPPSALRIRAIQEVLDYYINSLDSIEVAVAFLEAEGSLVSQRLLLPHYLETQDWSAASDVLSALNLYQGHPYDEAENQGYRKLYQVIYDLWSTDKQLLDWSSAQRQVVEEVAATRFGVSHTAQAVLAHVDGVRAKRIPDSSPFPQPRWEAESVSASAPKLKVYPNPAQGHLVLESSTIMHQAVLYNLLGVAVGSWQLETEQARLALPPMEGMYLLQVVLEDGSTSVERIYLGR